MESRVSKRLSEAASCPRVKSGLENHSLTQTGAGRPEYCRCFCLPNTLVAKIRSELRGFLQPHPTRDSQQFCFSSLSVSGSLRRVSAFVPPACQRHVGRSVMCLIESCQPTLLASGLGPEKAIGRKNLLSRIRSFHLELRSNASALCRTTPSMLDPVSNRDFFIENP